MLNTIATIIATFCRDNTVLHLVLAYPANNPAKMAGYKKSPDVCRGLVCWRMCAKALTGISSLFGAFCVILPQTHLSHFQNIRFLNAPLVCPLVASYSPAGATPRIGFSTKPKKAGPDVCCTGARCRPTLETHSKTEAGSPSVFTATRLIDQTR